MDKNKVYEDIRLQIVEEKLAPGQWLIERELCETYRMSRTPVREILWKLMADGFLEQEANRGFVVRRLGLEQIFEIFQAREAIRDQEKNRQGQYRIRSDAGYRTRPRASQGHHGRRAQRYHG